jgi:hypothetical protein
MERQPSIFENPHTNWSGRMFVQRAAEPELGKIPIAQNRFLRDPEHLGDFFRTETAKEFQLHNFTLARIIFCEGFQRTVEFGKIHIALGWQLSCLFQSQFLLKPTSFGTTVLNIVVFVVAAIAFTIVMTWVFNNTRGSLLMAVLVHTSFDTVLAILNRLFPVPIVNDYGSNVPILIGLGVLALVLVALTRGRFGYQRYRKEEPNSIAEPNVG